MSLKWYFYEFCCVFIFLGYHGNQVVMNTYRFYLRLNVSCICILDMIAVIFFRLSQFYDTLFELAILYSASGWGICSPIIWLSIKICCRVVENVTFPPEIYALKSICIQFLVKYTTFCIKLPFFC